MTYRIEGPAVINFSGGRTSGYMVRQILDAHGGTLPDDVKVAFCNTGKERPETLDFVRDVGAHWAVPITWLEYRWEPGRHFYEVVSHNSASRNGEPFDMLLAARSMLPNPVGRFCSIDMKIRTAERWVRAEFGWDHWTSVIGLRADERERVARSKARSDTTKDRWENDHPLHDAGATKAIVKAFWDAQPFDLRLLNVKGKTPHGNCDLCFMKSEATIRALIREQPEAADWWILRERNALKSASKATDATFRADRPSYAQMKKQVADQGDMVAGWGEDMPDCACTD